MYWTSLIQRCPNRSPPKVPLINEVSNWCRFIIVLWRHQGTDSSQWIFTPEWGLKQNPDTEPHCFYQSIIFNTRLVWLVGLMSPSSIPHPTPPHRSLLAQEWRRSREIQARQVQPEWAVWGTETRSITMWNEICCTASWIGTSCDLFVTRLQQSFFFFPSLLNLFHVAELPHVTIMWGGGRDRRTIKKDRL